MGGLYLLVPTLLVIFLSFLIVRAAAIGLMMTGMNEQRARFQALSAFSGTGFTTREAESVVNHPQRRKIMTWLMILGNAGIVTVIVSATSSIVTSQGYQLPISILILILGIYLVYKVAMRTGFMRRWERLVENRLVKSRFLEEGTVEDLFLLREDYVLARVIITSNSPLTGSLLSEVTPEDSELVTLGIERGNKWIAFPRTDQTIDEGDRVIVYGRTAILNHVFRKASKA